MGAQKSVEVQNAQLDAIETAVGTNAVFRMLSGVIPATTATAQTGTLLVGMTLPTDWANNAATGQKTKLGTWTGTAAATGDCGYWRLLNSAGTVCHYQGHLARPHAGTTLYTINQHVTNAGNVYRATSATGSTAAATPPTGTGGAITDGTVTWAYVTDAGGVVVPDSFGITSGQTVSISALTFDSGND